MARKALALLSRDIEIKAGVKKLSAEEYTELLSAQDVVEEAKEQAVQYHKQVEEECNALKEQAKKEGFDAGHAEWTEQVAHLEKGLEETRASFQKSIVPVALEAAKKILGREIELNPHAVADIVLNQLKSVGHHTHVTVYVHPQDLQEVEKEKEEYKKLFERLETLTVQPKEDVDRGGCIIETESGIINARLDNQWLALERAFQHLLG